MILSQVMKITEEMREQLNRQFNKSGVMITDVAIQSVRLPDKFARTMEQATMYTSDSEMQTMKQKFDLQNVDHDEQFHTEDQRRRECFFFLYFVLLYDWILY